ncbi:MAG: septum formation initiator family protein [Proteobacteria bacterium]|nr:septum formation initiator family protein [Pseudomonadota bacterium]
MTDNSTLRSALPLILFAVLAGGAAWACFGDRGILANRSLQAEVDSRQVRIEERTETIAHLRSEIARMETDTRVQERWIRQELGYVKPGELLYLFPGDRAADFAFLHDRHIEPGAQP